ncbi:MAG: Release factor glutamine methyltransferase [Firmicutes bacterium ADurb.Bin182]|nr:MAG: Release factor glutamine methyltransferase [Firmicutes bacterium ADurb.Bin182]
MPTVRGLLNEISGQLSSAGIADSALESRMMLCFVLDTDTAGLLRIYDEPAAKELTDRSFDMLKRRMSGEPLQYILGRWEFMGLPFIIRPCALIPRADTETLAEHAIGLIKKRSYRTVLDICCGSGCIGISIAKFTGAAVTAADVDEKCAALTQENAELNGISVRTAVSDMFGRIEQAFDIIVCNPPYIPSGEIPFLQREVLFEPVRALSGGHDGLDYYRMLYKEAPSHIRKGGVLLMEAGAGQADDIKKIFQGGYSVKDICGIERVIVVQY